jgi:hypothetical protein
MTKFTAVSAFSRLNAVVLVSAYLLILLTVNPVSGSSMVLAYGGGVSTHTAPSPLSLSAGQTSPFANVTLTQGGYGVNVTGNWISGMGVDNSGNGYFAEVDGQTFSVSLSGAYTYYGSPFNSVFAMNGTGAVTSAAVTPSGNVAGLGTQPEYVTLLTMGGYLYSYSFASGTWFNTSAVWGIAPSAYSTSPWTSLSSFGHDLFAVTITGSVLKVVVPSNGNPTAKFYPSASMAPVISATAIMGKVVQIHGHNHNHHASTRFVIFAVSSNSSIEEFSSATGAWSFAGNAPSPSAVSITQTPYSVHGSSANYYIYATSPDSSLPVYRAAFAFTTSPVVLAFTQFGSVPFGSGTVSAVGSSPNGIFVVSANGSIAYSPTGVGWTVTDYPVRAANYSSFILMASATATVSATPLAFTNLTSIAGFSLNFSNATSIYPQFQIGPQPGYGVRVYASSAPLSLRFNLNMSVTVSTNSSYDAEIVSQCTILFGQSVAMTLYLTIHVINHFYYEQP